MKVARHAERRRLRELQIEKGEGSYMKRTGSEHDKTRQGTLKEAERYFENQNQGMKSLKRQKSPVKSFVWADELKRQFTYTLKPSKCSSTDIAKATTADPYDEEGLSSEFTKLKPQQKFFTDMNIKNIFVNSEYFKMKSGNATSMSFCSGENGENRWTIDTKNSSAPRKTETPTSGKVMYPSTLKMDDPERLKKNTAVKKCETRTQAEELQYLRDNLDAMVQEMKVLNRDFGLVRMDIKTIEKLLRLQKQAAGKSKTSKKDGNQSDIDDINSKLGKFSEEVEKAAQELRDFIDNNRTLLIDEDVPQSPDMDKIISNLHRLSEAAYQPKITQTSKGAKFEIPREIPISLYADGILLRNSEFRKYTDVKAGLFLRDIEDGFYPSELWTEYPCGVPFQVSDRRYEVFNDETCEYLNRFPGNGRRLGSLFDGKPASMVYLVPTKQTLTGCGEPEKRPSNFPTQENYQNVHRTKSENGKRSDDFSGIPKLMSLKIRFGMGKEGTFQLHIMSNEKMSRFQDALFSKLCERFHDDYIKNIDLSTENNRYNEIVPDFELHVYGRKPFRLSEHLNSYPSECGIFDNCVVNITEI